MTTASSYFLNIKFVYLIGGLLSLSSCINSQMREITARNNGAKFWLLTANSDNDHWEYEGPVNKQNQAHGYGVYAAKDDFYGGNHMSGNGKFIHGQPDGDHQYENSLVAGLNHYSKGKHLGNTKTRNDMPRHLANVATTGAATLVASKNEVGAGSALAAGSGRASHTNVHANYPEGFAYNVTTYTGQYHSDLYDFTTTYGITTYKAARKHLEAGLFVYGGENKSERPGWFWIEKVPVRPGSQIRTGIVGVR